MAVSVADILKILEKIPDWARMKDLSERVEKLEARIAELESRLAAGGGEPDCEYCGQGAMRKVANEPSVDVPDLAVRLETWRCQACGEIDHRIAPPR